MEIKKIEYSELESLNIYEISKEETLYSFDGLKDLLISKYAFCVGVYDKELIGYAIFSFTDTYSTDLIYIFIKKNYRNQGIGTKLLVSSIYMLRQKNVHEIFLEVSRSNLVAINLYTALGFELIFTRKKYYRDDSDALIMKLQI